MSGYFLASVEFLALYLLQFLNLKILPRNLPSWAFDSWAESALSGKKVFLEILWNDDLIIILDPSIALVFLSVLTSSCRRQGRIECSIRNRLFSWAWACGSIRRFLCLAAREEWLGWSWIERGTCRMNPLYLYSVRLCLTSHPYVMLLHGMDPLELLDTKSSQNYFF